MENNRYREEEKEELKEQEKDKKLDDKKEEISQEEIKEEKPVEETEELDKLVPKKKYNKVKKQVNKLKEELALKDEKIAEINNEMLKDRAELENFKRRNNEERIKERKYANQPLVEDLLDMIDILDKAVSKETDDDKLNKYLAGFKMISNQIQDILNRYGLTKIESLGKPFDPMYHEAIEVVDVEGESNTIVEVIRDGYMFKDRVIRPSKVKVIK